MLRSGKSWFFRAPFPTRATGGGETCGELGAGQVFSGETIRTRCRLSSSSQSSRIETSTMATSTLADSRPPRRWRGMFAIFLAGFALLGVAIGFWLYCIVRSALPELDGTLSVSGLTAPVTVTRDGHGFPTIEAGNLEDLFFAQGYVTAQDRWFQMDGMRRSAAGELSEIVGEDQVEHDRQQRILGLRVAARKTLQIASAQDRSYFAAYARGINAYRESHRNRFPIEFRILHYSPQPWTIEDSLLIGAYMVEDLSTSPRPQLTREKILAKLGPQLTADLYVNSSRWDRAPGVLRPRLNQKNNEDYAGVSSLADLSKPPTPESGIERFTLLKLAGEPSGRQHEIARSLFGREWAFSAVPPIYGSNNWVVSGKRTFTGKPLLSNDMHLGYRMPNLWFAAHLRCGNFDVAGVTLPGYPYVIVGHNRQIAWGFTNLGPTVEDVYVETFNSAGQYLTPDGWESPEHRKEIIHVKGRPDVVVDVTLTRHGPIVTELVPGETRKLALRWTLYDGIRDPFFAVDSARNWEEFERALSQLDAPAQNVVYADIEGNIGYHATGKIPIRASGDGSLPENGSDNRQEWIGYVPFDQLPSVLNPSSGIIATANNRITPDAYPYSLSVEWEAPWRSWRIYRVLESGKKFSAADMLELETDLYSEPDRLFAERFVYAVDHHNNPSPRAKTAANILREWDGRMTAPSAAPTIAVRAREQLARLLLEPKLGPAPEDPLQAKSTLNWKSYRWFMETIWLNNILQNLPSRWLPEAYANYDDLLTAAVESAVGDPAAPKDLNTWQWGRFNAVDMNNPVLGRIPILEHWTGPGIKEQSGSQYTVKAVTKTQGPSERMTVDFANLDQSTLNLVTGEAGNFGSPYYMDQWEAWYRNFTFPWPFSPEAVAKARVHQLRLEPGS
jgi:penicillin G amidase